MIYIQIFKNSIWSLTSRALVGWQVYRESRVVRFGVSYN